MSWIVNMKSFCSFIPALGPYTPPRGGEFHEPVGVVWHGIHSWPILPTQVCQIKHASFSSETKIFQICGDVWLELFSGQTGRSGCSPPPKVHRQDPSLLGHVAPLWQWPLLVHAEVHLQVLLQKTSPCTVMQCIKYTCYIHPTLW